MIMIEKIIEIILEYLKNNKYLYNKLENIYYFNKYYDFIQIRIH